MDWLFTLITPEQMTWWTENLDFWMLALAVVLLCVELIRYGMRRQLTWTLLGDIGANIVTQLAFIAITVIALFGFYIATYYTVAEFAIFQIDTTWASFLACLLLADFAYYWEHRFSHRVGAAWATHSVHHASPHFNQSVAYRIGPLDWLVPLPFHMPLLLIGFDPELVFFAEFLVLLYQTPIHTEVIGKLPRWIEAVFNTPSHHRVHHGANPQYLDTNYGGILIIWDRLFGTFAREDAKVDFGLVEPLNSINPIRIWFHGFTRLYRRAKNAGGLGKGLHTLIAPPDWSPDRRPVADP